MPKELHGNLDPSELLCGRRVLVMGLGLHGGGVGTVKYLSQKGARIKVTDLRNRRALHGSLVQLRHLRGISYVLGRHRAKDFLEADLIIKNPGVSPNSPFLAIAKKSGVPFTTDLGLFFARCQAPIIGVTGTRGKSTTAYLVWRFLKDGLIRGSKRREIFLGGNIRKSVLDFLDKATHSDVVVLELSSFQLQDLAADRVSPHISVLTNIYRDHLNRHQDFSEYIAAKSIIFKYQKRTDLLFANRNDKRIRRMVKKAPSGVVFPYLPAEFKNVVLENLGRHYEPAVALAVAVARHFGVKDSTIDGILKKFKGLEGRQEAVGRVNGVLWVNDTTATIPDATLAAVLRFKVLCRRLILIAGGQDKKLDFNVFVREVFRKVNHLILLPGTATDKMVKILRPALRKKPAGVEVRMVKNMQEAVRAAASAARTGDCVLLSPGAASFGLFLNEFDRGARFTEELRKISSRDSHVS